MFGILSKDDIDRQAVTQRLNVSVLGENMGNNSSHGFRAHIFGRKVYKHNNVIVASDSQIYNSPQLKKLIDDEPRDEAHLICMLYFKYGEECFEKLRGPFSICIVDNRDKKLYVATDRFGIKPLVYYAGNNNFIFGSRIADIISIESVNVPAIDYEALMDYINLSAIPTPKTIFRSIRKLAPGHFLSISGIAMQPRITKYYDIEYTVKRKSENYFIERIPLHIEETVKTMLDYELTKGNSVGAFLSGGTDSSTITGMIKKIRGDVKTFSIGFDEPGYNELGYAQIAAHHFGAKHHEYIVKAEDVMRAIDVILDVYDEPFGNASAVPVYFCALLAKDNGVDTLFAGDGGDEIFGGNERYSADRIFSIYPRIPSLLRKGVIEPLITAAPSSISFINRGKKYVRRANIPHPDRFFSYNPVNEFGKEAIFSPDLLRHLNGYDQNQWARELYKDSGSSDELNKLLYIDMKFTITDNDLRKVIGVSEYAGEGVVFPFLDHGLVDFAASIPAKFKVKGKRLRYIFKKAMEDFLPYEIIRKKKHGFGLPIGLWIRTKPEISSFAKENLLSSTCSIKPIFRKGFIEKLFKMHDETGMTFYGDTIWVLLMLELWKKKYSAMTLNKVNNTISQY